MVGERVTFGNGGQERVGERTRDGTLGGPEVRSNAPLKPGVSGLGRSKRFQSKSLRWKPCGTVSGDSS